MRASPTRTAGAAFALALGTMLAGCGGVATNNSLESVHQPIVQQSLFTLDIGTTPYDGIPVAEQRRLTGWLDALDLRYGDRIAVDDPSANPAVREALATVAGRYGLLVSDAAPVSAGALQPGLARVLVIRSVATVPGCPDWSAHSDINLLNATYPNYGCATNSNLAAMIADPQDLIEGKRGTGETVIMSSTKAIGAYRAKAPTGAGALAATSTAAGGN